MGRAAENAVVWHATLATLLRRGNQADTASAVVCVRLGRLPPLPPSLLPPPPLLAVLALVLFLVVLVVLVVL